jgi:hypothetical protein
MNQQLNAVLSGKLEQRCNMHSPNSIHGNHTALLPTMAAQRDTFLTGVGVNGERTDGKDTIYDASSS